MAFVCTVTQGQFRVQGFTAGAPRIAVIDIGYDDAEPLNYKATVGLDTLPGGCPELYFHVIEADGATGGEHPFWSGRDTRFIGRAVDRAAVLEAILYGLRDLLEANSPDEMRWFTYDEMQPAKALLKFDAVRNVVERCGYAVTSSRLSRGRRAWHAVRLQGSAVDTGGGGPDPIRERP